MGGGGVSDPTKAGTEKGEERGSGRWVGAKADPALNSLVVSFNLAVDGRIDTLGPRKREVDARFE